jgi:small subunit ribosomal protein S21
LQVLVRDNNVDQALKALKKKMQREGIFREMKLRNYFEKPSEKKAREKAEAVRRARKLARKKMQREGLLPSKPANKNARGGGRGGPGRGGFNSSSSSSSNSSGGSQNTAASSSAR